MLQSKIGRNFLICFVLLNVLLAGAFVYAVMKQPGLLSSVLPGQFGLTASPDLSGNMLFYALVLLVNAALFLLFGLGGTWHAMASGLRISPRKMRWLLHERVGLANDISGIVAAAVQEEEKSEIVYLGWARALLLIGLLLFAGALPALCIAYTHAAPNGPAIFENAGVPVANGDVSQGNVMRFTADQLAGGLLLDIPEIFHLRATPVESNGANLWLGVLVLLYRTLIGLGLLLWFVAGRRVSSLRDFAMEVAMPAADIVAMEPMMQDGHGHHDHSHDAPVHGDHARHDHSDHTHTDRAHEDQRHDDHAAHDSEDAPANDEPVHHDHAHEDHSAHHDTAHDDGHAAKDDSAHSDDGHHGNDHVDHTHVDAGHVAHATHHAEAEADADGTDEGDSDAEDHPVQDDHHEHDKHHAPA
jgi:uncharacterized membrane protein YgdD (TMEM256/DUF423 family)